MKFTKIKKIILFTVPTGMIIIGLILFFIIYFPLNDIVNKSQEKYDGDYVESLIIYLESDKQSFKEKNHAIWALGEIADKRAVPVLEKFLTHEKCEKPCRTDKYICQYQLEKSIHFCSEGLLLSNGFRFLLDL